MDTRQGPGQEGTWSLSGLILTIVDAAATAAGQGDDARQSPRLAGTTPPSRRPSPATGAASPSLALRLGAPATASAAAVGDDAGPGTPSSVGSSPSRDSSAGEHVRQHAVAVAPQSMQLQQLTHRRSLSSYSGSTSPSSSTGGDRATANADIGAGDGAAGVASAAEERSDAAAGVVAGLSESAAEAAARHRLSNPQGLDLHAAAQWLEQLLPYACLLALVFLYHHLSGILLAGWLLGSLIKANQTVRKQVALKADFQRTEVAATLLYIVTNVAGVVWLTSGDRLWRSFLLLPPTNPFTVWQAAFVVLVVDSLIRFGGLLPKLLLVAATQTLGRPGPKAQRRQARLLTLVEYVVLNYRSLIPIPVWYTYLLTCTRNSAFCSLLAGFYLTFKGYACARRLRLLGLAVQLVLRSGALYGRYVSRDELAEAGDAAAGVCPVCQDEAQVAVRLDCSHTFCEDCISEWLERDTTGSCPMCRASVKPHGLQSYSDGATSLLPLLF